MDKYRLAKATGAWMEQHLVVHDKPHTPFRLTDEMAEVLFHVYELDAWGNRVYYGAQMTWPKGMGKSPYAGAFCAAEAWGPPAPAMPNIQVVAFSQAAAGNTWDALRGMVDPANGAKGFAGIDSAKTRILDGPIKLEPVTASSKTRRGARVTFAVLDEVSIWQGSQGHDLWDEVTANLTKTGGWYLETTNAFVPGEDSVAERTWMEGTENQSGVYISWPSVPDALKVEEEELKDEHKVRRALKAVYGGSHWVPIDAMVAKAASGRNNTRFRQDHFNERVIPEHKFIDVRVWDKLTTGDLIPGEPVVAGFDGAEREDSTALVVQGLESGVLKLYGLWEKPSHLTDWYVPREKVDTRVSQLFEGHEVKRMYVDPPYWRNELVRWQESYGHDVVIAWENSRTTQMTAAIERFEESVRQDDLIVHANGDLRSHVANTQKVSAGRGGHGLALYKEHKNSPKKIDACVAAVVCHEAWADQKKASGKSKTKEPGKLIVGSYF